jgi:hypothetical protein
MIFFKGRFRPVQDSLSQRGNRSLKRIQCFFYGVGRLLGRTNNKWNYQTTFATPPGWELYDLRPDPYEMNKGYDDPEYTKMVMDLKKRFRALRKKIKEDDPSGLQTTPCEKRWKPPTGRLINIGTIPPQGQNDFR